MLPLEYEQETSPWVTFDPEKFPFKNDSAKVKRPT